MEACKYKIHLLSVLVFTFSDPGAGYSTEGETQPGPDRILTPGLADTEGAKRSLRGGGGWDFHLGQPKSQFAREFFSGGDSTQESGSHPERKSHSG